MCLRLVTKPRGKGGYACTPSCRGTALLVACSDARMRHQSPRRRSIGPGGLAAGFPAFAFDTTDFPATPPPVHDRIALGTYSGDAASFEPVVFSGALVAYDAPVVVGTWEVTVSAVPEPESYAMLLAGLGLLSFAARRRKLKAA